MKNELKNQIILSKFQIQNSKFHFGITLIALVVTLVVLLILAGISVTMLFGKSGIITKAEEAKLAQKKANFEDRIGLVNLDAQSKKILEGKLTPEDYFEILKEHGMITDTKVGGDNKIQDTGRKDEKGNTIYEITTEDEDVFEVSIDEEGNIKIEYKGDIGENTVGIRDNIDPTATIELSATTVNVGTTVTATVTQTDEQSGVDLVASKWIFNTTSSKADEESTVWNTATAFSTTATPSFTPSSPETYYLHVLTVDLAGNKTASISGAITVTLPTISQTTSYVGYYADLTGDGTVDGVIYADLAVGGSGEWATNNGTYTIPTETGLKSYYVSQTSYSGKFGTKAVLSPTGSGKDRFYVMALSDISSSFYCWYDAAYENMSDYAEATSVDFGTGKTNTANMISKWNSKAYGAQDDNSTYKDVWGQIQTQYNNGWFVLSRGEWAAFAAAFGIAKTSNYSSFGLSSNYWSSSQSNTSNVWGTAFDYGFMGNYGVNCYDCVRLGTTF